VASLERMSCVVDHDICNRSVPCMNDGCHGFRDSMQLAASCLHQVNCRLMWQFTSKRSKPSHI